MSPAKEPQESSPLTPRRQVQKLVGLLSTRTRTVALRELMAMAPKVGLGQNPSLADYECAYLAAEALRDVVLGAHDEEICSTALDHLARLTGSRDEQFQIWGINAVKAIGTAVPYGSEAPRVVAALRHAALVAFRSEVSMKAAIDAVHEIRAADLRDKSGATAALEHIRRSMLTSELKQLAELRSRSASTYAPSIEDRTAGLSPLCQDALTGDGIRQRSAIDELVGRAKTTAKSKNAEVIVATLHEIAADAFRSTGNKSAAIEALDDIRKSPGRGAEFALEALRTLNEPAPNDTGTAGVFATRSNPSTGLSL